MTKDDAIKAIEGKRIADPSGYAIDVAFNDAIDIAIEAIRALPDAGWRDIESAPKDGTRILLFTGTMSGDDDLLNYIVDVCEGVHFSCVQIGSWDGVKWEKEKIGHVVAWMPLPQPPEKA